MDRDLLLGDPIENAFTTDPSRLIILLDRFMENFRKKEDFLNLTPKKMSDFMISLFKFIDSIGELVFEDYDRLIMEGEDINITDMAGVSDLLTRIDNWREIRHEKSTLYVLDRLGLDKTRIRFV
ncbi:MAG: hypothetical protein ACFFD1_16395 [Candidatus Thorarchaeota archaeon]